MNNQSIVNSGIPFSANHQSETMGTGTDACRTTVVIKHFVKHDENLTQTFRILPKGITVVVYDEAGNFYPAKIDRSGFSRHEQVRCGEISWQLMRSTAATDEKVPYDNSGITRRLSADDESFVFDKSDGYVLIQADDVKSKDPRKQFCDPLRVFASYGTDGIANIKAAYLPPPMLLNLRFNQQINKEQVQQNMDKLIRQIEFDGKNVTLFIHGFNVPLGHIGSFPSATELGQLPPYDTLPRSSEAFQRPSIYYADIIGETVNHRIKQQAQALYTEDYQQLLKGPQGKINGQPVLTGTKAPYEDLDKVLNGEDSLAWFPSVEYYLNLAASGKLSPSDKFTDWDKYSRILGVTWSGNIEPPNVFFRAEMYANETGRELAKFLQMLINRGIKINIITHSLGARVALSALNILGDFDGEYDRKIDNLIMLEAAVADNAITKHYTKAHNPLAMELFPFAHKAVQSIQVMYSLEDGVLGADNRVWDFDDGVSDISRGAYPLKYGMFANRNRAMRDYYPHDNAPDSVTRHKSEALQYHLQMECLANMGRADKDVAGLCGYFAGRPAFDRRVIAANVRALIAAEMEKVNEDWQVELNILRPWSHFRRFPEDADYVQHIIEVLTTVIFKVDWALPAEALEIRPALGYLGNMLTSPNSDQKIDKKLAKKYPVDTFIMKQKDKTFFFHNQSAYFASHSVMKDLIWEEMVRTDKQREKMKPTRFSQIYTITYKREIMDKYIKGKSKFGRYSWEKNGK
ncbi:hypothetical protein H5P1_0211100 [Aggregatibacter actinomycetemcomitans serotype a str. H5P1]|uniref:alpha/beta hydrolase n=1 Tax=Aggregatibacter actinomycetemcomitans TaxID=714 RepID=UPI00022AD5E0|nr:alpha/beta hydrolase [Aggregatibacter actinomycetemcomitans]KND82269.1 hypothetical protein H5P1_0211100 [Aggregatibacter actinomycetemcomitans serotype a str. H5P1]